MKIYLAGGVSGNLKPLYRKLYLAGDTYRKDILMKLYLAGSNGREKLIENNLKELQEKKYKVNILESFYYIDDTIIKFIPYFDNFLLDSGAYTFMANSKNKDINWDEYVEKYAKFINDYDIKLFFELDIDKLVGLKEVERLRNKLEALTKKQCIPVWHKSRGLDYYKKMCKNYDYIAIGGIVVKEITSKEYKYFTPLLKIAKKNNCKVHGLGFTNLKGLIKYHFYSVDSTAWTTGNRFGAIYKFNGKTLQKYKKPQGMRVKNKETAFNNFIEWIKFSNYADKNL